MEEEENNMSAGKFAKRRNWWIREKMEKKRETTGKGRGEEEKKRSRKEKKNREYKMKRSRGTQKTVGRIGIQITVRVGG